MKKGVIIIVIVVLLVILVALIWFYFTPNNKCEKGFNIYQKDHLNYFKCVSNCPEIEINSTGKYAPETSCNKNCADNVPQQSDYLTQCFENNKKLLERKNSISNDLLSCGMYKIDPSHFLDKKCVEEKLQKYSYLLK